MAGISFAGMGSGIDFDSLRQALMLVEQQTLTRITNKQSALKQKKDAYKDIDGRMDSLYNTLKPILDTSSSNTFKKVTAVSSNTSVFTASASSTAASATYDVKVKSLAQLERVISAQGASASNFTAGYAGSDLNTLIESNITKLGSLHRRDNGTAFADADLGQLSIDDGVSGPVTVDLGASLTTGSTVQDMITDINNQLGLGGSTVTVALNAAGNGLEFSSGTGNISISDGVDGKQSATKLGVATAGMIAAPVDGGDLDPSIQLDSTLAALNAGAGIGDLASGVTLRMGTTTSTLDLSTATTVQDVITEVNGAGMSMTAAIAADGKGFRIDATSANKSLAIEENGGSTASNLGLFGDSHVLKMKKSSDASFFNVYLNGGLDGDGGDLSLEDIRDSINAVSGKTFEASLVDSRLIIQSDDVGSANSLMMKDNKLSGGILEELGILENDALDDTTIADDFSGDSTKGGYLQAASDAVFSVNGITINRSQNTSITDVIDGVTLNLVAPSSYTGAGVFPADYSSLTLTIKKDTDTIATSIESFVNQYNSTIDLISSSTKLNPDGDDGVLATDSLAKNLGSMLFYQVSKLNPDLGYDHRSIFELKDADGNYAFKVSNTATGKIELNKTALKNILEDDPDSVADVLRYDSNGDGTFDGGIAYSLSSFVNSYANSTNGVLQKQMDSYQSELDDLEDNMLEQQERLDKKNEALKLKFAAADQLISSLNSQSNYISGQLASLSR